MAIFEGILILVSVAVPPAIFGFLLFYGLTINDRKEQQSRQDRTDSHRKHPFSIPFEGDQNS